MIIMIAVSAIEIDSRAAPTPNVMMKNAAAPTPKLMMKNAKAKEPLPYTKCMKTLKFYGNCETLKNIDAHKARLCMSSNNVYKRQFKHSNPKCNLPRNFGNKCINGKNPQILWYWNNKLGLCKAFKFLGCNGNENQFKHKLDCINQCGVLMKNEDVIISKDSQIQKDEIPMQKEKEAVSRKSQSPEPEKPNIEERKTENSNICSLQKEVGICRALIPRFFYNDNSSKCEPFNYGGCGGNENNFETLNECKDRCERHSEDKNECSLEPDSGPCEAIQIRYHYSKEEKKCKKFVYGGCGGNKNRFNNESECLRNCT